MSLRLTLHPGFHKTGTSSAQHFLWRNRKQLSDRLRIYQLRHLRSVADLCMRYARKRTPLTMHDLHPALDAVFAGAPEDRDILVTCEGLSGHIPGWPKVTDYGAALSTLPHMTGYLAQRFPAHRPLILLTTRDPDAWLYSAWRHNLMGHRLQEDWPTFAGRLGTAARLDDMARKIAQAVAPVPVQTLSLDTAQDHSLGPGGALLAAAGHDPAGLVAVSPGNRGPDKALSRTLLQLNRSALPDADLKARKRALCDAAGVGGWARD